MLNYWNIANGKILLAIINQNQNENIASSYSERDRVQQEETEERKATERKRKRGEAKNVKETNEHRSGENMYPVLYQNNQLVNCLPFLHLFLLCVCVCLVWSSCESKNTLCAIIQNHYKMTYVRIKHNNY